MFEGQVILITGAASGLGRAWAEGFSADGAQVIAADINGLTVEPRGHLNADVVHDAPSVQFSGAEHAP